MIEKIFKEFCNSYRIKMSHKDSKFKAKIITPFGGLDSNPITFTVRQITENKLLLCDELSTYMYFDRNFYSPTDNALDFMMKISKTYGLYLENFHYYKEIDISSSYWKEDIIDFITALIKLQDIVFLKKEVIVKEFLEIIKEFINAHFDVRYKTFAQGIQSLDSDNLYPVDISLSNDKNNFVNIYAISNNNRLNDATISMMYYRYEAPKEMSFYNISIFDDLNHFTQGNKYKRMLAMSDKTLGDFKDFDRKILSEELRKKFNI